MQIKKSPRWWAFGITLLFLSLWIIPLNEHVTKIVQAKEMHFLYMVIYFSILCISMIAVPITWLAELKRRWVLLLGALVGQVIGFTAVIMSNLIPNGVDLTIKFIRMSGFLAFIVPNAVGSFVLGGWLIGAFAFLIYKESLVRLSKRMNSNKG